MWGHVDSEASDGGSVAIQQRKLVFYTPGLRWLLSGFLQKHVFSDLLFLIGNL